MQCPFQADFAVRLAPSCMALPCSSTRQGHDIQGRFLSDEMTAHLQTCSLSTTSRLAVHNTRHAVSGSVGGLGYSPMPPCGSRVRLPHVPRCLDTHTSAPGSHTVTCWDKQTMFPRKYLSNRHTLPRVQDAFKDSMIHKLCNSHYVSHFAAFFIVARTKRSIVKSCCVLQMYMALRMSMCRYALVGHAMLPWCNCSSCVSVEEPRAAGILCFSTACSINLVPSITARQYPTYPQKQSRSSFHSVSIANGCSSASVGGLCISDRHFCIVSESVRRAAWPFCWDKSIPIQVTCPDATLNDAHPPISMLPHPCACCVSPIVHTMSIPCRYNAIQPGKKRLCKTHSHHVTRPCIHFNRRIPCTHGHHPNTFSLPSIPSHHTITSYHHSTHHHSINTTKKQY